MNLSNIFFTWYSEVSCLHNRSVDVLTPVLTHLLLVDYAQELCDKLRVDGQKLNQAIPDAEDLISYHFDVASDESCDFIRLTIARKKASLEW